YAYVVRHLKWFITSNAHPNCHPDPGRRAQEISQRMPSEYVQLGKCSCACRHCGALIWAAEKLASSSRITGPDITNALMIPSSFCDDPYECLFRQSGSIRSQGTRNYCSGGKGGDPEVGSSSHIDGPTRNFGSINFTPQGHLGFRRKRFRNRQLADNGVATDDTGCNSVQYEGVTSAYIDLGTAPEITYEEPF
ncbi:hypothetical protein Tco_0651634, partial [Tanacetum coccineum]